MYWRVSVAALAGAAALALAGSALATPYYFTFANADPTDDYGDISGYGSLDTVGGFPSTLDWIDGSLSGASSEAGDSGQITGLSPYAGADNTVYDHGTVSFAGISFDVGATAYNIYHWKGTNWLLSSNIDPVGYPQNGTPINFEICVPEPATWAMLVFGVAMVGSALRRRNVGVTISV
jgi:hypothetical protein